MKIVLDNEQENEYECKVTLETGSVDIHKVIDDIFNGLLAMGFTPGTVKDGILAKAEEYETVL